MNLRSKTARKPRGLILTEEAFQLVDRELRERWESSAAKQSSEASKLTREVKADLLGLDVKTVDKITRREPVSKLALQTVFDNLNILFSQQQHCISSTPSCGNLPHVSTRCIGREAVVQEIKELLQTYALITLTGSGGVGKTRLAIQVAEHVKGHYTDGIWFVGLAEVLDPTAVPQRVATTLGVQEEKDQPLTQTLADFLRKKRLLLILDNCEHVLEACAKLADQLLSASPRLRVLATSRERLNISAERPWTVPSLSVPDVKRLASTEKDRGDFVLASDAVRLFVERASVQRPDFTVTNLNAPILAAICHRLDGIPLAIELAAARMRAMSLDDLERGLHDCFHLLTGGNKAALPRHQTLRATMDWSYDLLEEKQQALYRRLSVFVGGCRLEAAEQVCTSGEIEASEVLDLLTSLVDKSLVRYEEWEGIARYHLLETVRQYGRDRLADRGENDVVQERHRDYFLALVQEAEPKLIGVEQIEWLQRLETEHDNLRAALSWSLMTRKDDRTEAHETQPLVPASLLFCGALLRFRLTHGHLGEGRMWCVQALAAEGAEERTAARARTLNAVGLLVRNQDDFASARLYQEESLATFRGLGDQMNIALSLSNLGGVAHHQENYAAASAYIAESLEIYRKISHRWGIAASLNCLGVVAHLQAEYTSSRTYHKESLTIFQGIGDKQSIAGSLDSFAATIAAQAIAVTTPEETTENTRAGVGHAALLWGAAQALREEIGSPLPPILRDRYDRNVTDARAAMDAPTFSTAWETGRAMPMEQAVAYALSLEAE